MTAIARTPRSAERPYEIDVRCSAAIPREAAAEGRCQLFAGHDGPHAVMFVRCGKRTVQTWTVSDAVGHTDAGSDALRRPWMFGYPAPAWYETGIPTERPA